MHSLPHPHRPKRRRFIVIALSAVAVVIAVNIALIVPDSDTATPVAAPFADAAPLLISTDRSSYQSGEPVKIIFMNSTRNALAETATTSLTLSAAAGLGENFGVGLIERETASGYVAVEPVWRCGGDCSMPCGEAHALPPAGATTLTWDQAVRRCGAETGSLTASAAASGRYRVTAAVWDEQSGSAMLVSSLPFSIIDR